MRISIAIWLLAVLFCYMHLCRHVFVASALCLDDQRSLLLQFKNTEGPTALDYAGAGVYSGRLGAWNESVDCCQWSGVTCDNDGHVIGLDLSGEGISAELNSSSGLFGLRYLESLNLANNIFQDEITSEFKKLENLTYLNLSEATFRGQIPLEISQLKRLEILDLSSNHLKLENPNLGKLVQNLTKIRQLYLDDVSVSLQGQEWTAALLQIPTLQELSMSDCNLSGPLQPSLAMLENLSVINFDRNNFSSSVPESYASFRNLTTLGLRHCDLNGVFPQKIFQVPTLSFIDMSYNLALQGSFPNFPPNGSLQTLLVSYTNFSGPLPKSVSNLTQLVEMDLSWNRFSGPIPSLAACKKLQTVALYENFFSGSIFSTHFEGLVNLEDIRLENNYFTGKIPTSIFMLPSLKVVLFSNNKFEGLLNVSMNATSAIVHLDLSRNHLEGPIPISKLVNLRYLDLSGNNLSKIDATKTPPSFPLFPNLVQVDLASCMLTTFPQFLKNQTSMIVLDLSNNHITGTVPYWISKLNSLLYLNISNNYLSNWEEPSLSNMSLGLLDLHSNHLRGPLPALPPTLYYLDYSSNNLSSSIPPSIGNILYNAEFVSLSSNNLHGNIPESICNASIEFLILSNNALTGKIPQCLIAMNGALTILDLGRNKLNGTIDTFPGSCRLRSLYLSGNSLQGKLPKYLINCTMLEVLDVGDNQIEDQFPCWLKKIPSLRVLILRSNKLHGSLKCQGIQVGWPPFLQIFDLGSNNFGGSIPPSFFETWEAMMGGENDGRNRPFHLSIPNSVSTYRASYWDKVAVTSKGQKMELVKILTIFTTIDLSDNKFEGSLPDDLGQLNALHRLNLSHNAFSGNIPSSLGNMKDLESLDLSDNNLSGEIPRELASLSFLSSLNLSYNHLVGKIPTGGQIQSFGADSFRGNDGLWEPVLTPNCSVGGLQGTSAVASNSNKGSSIQWNFIVAELGFTFAIGIIVWLLVFHKGWRIWYWKRVDNILYHIFPQLDFVIERRNGQSYRALRWKPY